MMPWRVVIDRGLSGASQMARDAGLASGQEVEPTVRLFTWDPPAVSLGWKQPRPAWLTGSPEPVCEVVERPTGGGIAFHGTDVSMAIIVPRTMRPSLDQLMADVCQSAAMVCELFGAAATWAVEACHTGRITYCLAEASPYAVYLGGRKVAGFALRRYPQTWLVQGSLLVRPLSETIRRMIPAAVMEQLVTHAISLSEAAGRTIAEEDVIRAWAEPWTATACADLVVS